MWADCLRPNHIPAPRGWRLGRRHQFVLLKVGILGPERAGLVGNESLQDPSYRDRRRSKPLKDKAQDHQKDECRENRKTGPDHRRLKPVLLLNL